jgi:alkyl hydroperoxide reductase subunit AhpC
VVTVRNDFDRFGQAGGKVVAVTMGDVEQAAAFRAKHRLQFSCLADPERQVYKAYQVRQGGLTNIAGPAVWLPGLKSVARAGIGKPVGDIRQLQAGFVVASDGVLRLVHYPDYSSDNLSNAEVIEVLTSIAKPQHD